MRSAAGGNRPRRPLWPARAEKRPSGAGSQGRALHGAHGCVLHAGEDVAVGGHGLGDGRVPEHLLDALGVDVLPEQQSCAGVAQAVEREPGEPGLLQEGLEVPLVEVVVVHGLAEAVGEHDAMTTVHTAVGSPSRCRRMAALGTCATRSETQRRISGHYSGRFS